MGVHINIICKKQICSYQFFRPTYGEDNHRSFSQLVKYTGGSGHLLPLPGLHFFFVCSIFVFFVLYFAFHVLIFLIFILSVLITTMKGLIHSEDSDGDNNEHFKKI